MEFRLLGPVAVIDEGAERMIRQRRQRALLALLLLHRGETVSIDRLVDELWGHGAPRTARASLHNGVSQLRRALDTDALVTRPPGYVLEVEPATIDSVRFEHLLAEAQAARSVQDHGTAAVVLREALALWRGPALADLSYEPFAQAEIRRLEELRQTALEDRIEADLARGRHEEVVPELDRLVADEPLRERGWGLLMLALYRAGRQADSLASYRSARHVLVDELGIEPGPELKGLEQAILRQDASLLLAGSGPVVAAPAPMQFRRLATILSADALVVGAGDDTPDPETAHRLLVTHAETARAVVTRHGGWLDRTSGETLLAAFGAPAADETHALRAARAALDLQSAVESVNAGSAELDARLELRVGVATGEVLASASHAREQFVTGDAVRVAGGLQQAAGAGEVLLGPLTRRLVGPADAEPRGELEVRGRAKPLAAFRLVALRSAETPSEEERLEAPLIGRAPELKSLRAMLRRSRGTRKPEASLVVGPAGIGKSRLVRELVKSAKGVDTLVARCPSYGEGVTYWPLRRLVGDDRAAIRTAVADELDADVIADRLARFDAPAPEIAWAFRRWCEARAGSRPLLLVVDDLHWAEPTFLDLLEHLVDHGSGRIALVGLAREELLEDRPTFMSAEQLVLDGLPAAATETLVEHLLGGGPLPSDSRARVLEAAEGNPLFLEQLVALAMEGDPLGADQPLPVTVQALLAARLDRLGPGERAVLERASVVGRDFTTSDVTMLLDPVAVPTVDRHLTSLVRRGFVRGVGAGAFRFRHVLLQEATYRAAPKKLRSALHERFADALDKDVEAPDVLVGYHLERAYQLRAELGPPDRTALRIAEDAGRRLGVAGLRAWKREDAPAAVNLLRRATDLLPEADRGRLELLCELGTALKGVAGDEQSGEILATAAQLASQVGDRPIALRAQLETAWPRFVRGEVAATEMLALAEASIAAFEMQSDGRGLARAWHVKAAASLVGYRSAACADAAGRALEHYERSGYATSGCVSMLASALAHGPEPVDVAIERCRALIDRTSTEALGRSYVLMFVALLESMGARPAAARHLFEEARSIIEDRGAPLSDDWTSIAASIEQLAGDDARAESILRDACERLADSSDVAWLATFLAGLGEAVYAQGRHAEALELAERAQTIAPADDLLVQTAWRRVRAKAQARVGSFVEAERLATEAVELLETTDSLTEHGSALIDLAEVLVLAAKPEDAERALDRGLTLLAAKGNTAAIARARARIAGLGTTAVAR